MSSRLAVLAVLALAACGSGGGGPVEVDASPPADAPPASRCGDGVVDPGEACDDGNDVDTDSCVHCQLARCGDGVVWRGVETCDDGTPGCVACGSCPGVRDPATGHCYTFDPAPVSRADAETGCAAAGGHLASLEDAGEWTTIAPLWVDPYPSSWLGLTRTASGASTFQWETGVALGASSWNGGEPNDSGGSEDCVEVFGATGVWNDVSCTATRASLCERDAWSIDPATHHAYRTFYRLRTHPEAVADCAAMGAHLVTITSDEEQAFVASIAPLAVWIGAFQGQSEASWYWPDGEAFGYTDWAPGQPDDYDHDEDCAEIFAHDGHWNDLDCTTHQPYLCEVD